MNFFRKRVNGEYKEDSIDASPLEGD